MDAISVSLASAQSVGLNHAMLGNILLSLALLLPGLAFAGQVQLAVASSTLPAVTALAHAFESESGHDVRIAHGATGKLFSQITKGAPFDIFLSADQDRPARLEEIGLTSGRVSYAEGTLSLMGNFEGDPLTALPDILRGQRVAIADPELAPYGSAAIEVLLSLGTDLADIELVLGENIGQVAVWLATRNVDYGILATSLVGQVQAKREIGAFPVPHDLYAPLFQDAVLLTRAASSDAALAFWDWLAGPEAKAILARHDLGLRQR